MKEADEIRKGGRERLQKFRDEKRRQGFKPFSTWLTENQIDVINALQVEKSFKSKDQSFRFIMNFFMRSYKPSAPKIDKDSYYENLNRIFEAYTGLSERISQVKALYEKTLKGKDWNRETLNMEINRARKRLGLIG